MCQNVKTGTTAGQLLGCRPTSPCNAPTLPCYRARVGAALEPPAASNLCAPTRAMARAPAGNAKTHSTTVSSTSSFRHRRRRRRRRGRLLGRQAAGRGSTFGGAGKDACTAPAHEHARALSAIDPCCGHELARLGSPSAARSVARASRRAAGKGRAQVDGNSCFVRAGTNVCSRLPRKRSTARRRCS